MARQAPRRQRQRQRQRGFTLIEAIVALVLMATTGMALFSWVNSNIITLNRVQASNTQDAATANALEYLSGINPMATPEGSAALGSYKLLWQAKPIADPRDGASYPVGISLYQIGLYQTEVSIERLDGQAWFAFRLQQVGYKKVRDVRPPF